MFRQKTQLLLSLTIIIPLLCYSSVGLCENYKTHVVKKGDSIAKIADFYGVSQDELREINDLTKGAPLKIGEELVIPDQLRDNASKGHVVREGDTLSSIADKYKVSTKALAFENKISVGGPLEIGRTLVVPEDDSEKAQNRHSEKPEKLVKTGRKVPNGVMQTVQPGQSLWTIARAYNISGKKILKANGLTKEQSIRVDKEILIPGAKEVVPVRIKGYAIPRIHFVRVANSEQAKLRLTTKSGKINGPSRKVLSNLARARSGKKRVKLLHPRLIHILQRVAERFPGRTIEIISGYRARKSGAKLSKHNEGKALDFRVSGISNQELYAFIKELPNVGAGYYPNSVFVHIDVRDKTALWTDRSGPGDPPQYVKPGQEEEGQTDPAFEAASDAVPEE